MKNKKGLTLIEVIVAIALVGIIAITMIPAFAGLFKMTVDTKDITIKSYNAQGAAENAIFELKKVLQNAKVANVTPVISGIEGASIPPTKKIFGKDVSSMYKLLIAYPLNDKKQIVVYLSKRLNEESTTIKPAENVYIDVSTESNDPSDKVADMTKSPKPVLRGMVNANSDVNWYANVYKWYVSEAGNPNPVFPNDYEMILVPGTQKDLTDLTGVVNRFVVFTVTPVDIHGVRGLEVSSNKVYIFGEEWRAGSYAWIDKNPEDLTYTATTDVNLIKEQLLIPFDSSKTFLNPEVKIVDPSNGSLYVPMSMNPDNPASDTVGPLKIAGATAKLDWYIDKGINLATDITVSNGTDISLKTRDGNITLYQYLLLDSTRKASIDTSTGLSKLINQAPELKTSGDILFNTEGKGNIMLQSYSKLTAGGDVKLLCHGTYKMYDGNILAGGEIDLDSSQGVAYPGNRDLYINNSTLNAANISLASRNNMNIFNSNIYGNSSGESHTILSAPDGISLNETNFTNTNIDLNNNTTMSGGGWTGKILTVANGKTLTVQKGNSKVQNPINKLILGDTGKVVFKNRNNFDLQNPLEIFLTGSSNQVKIKTDYGRNIGYAGSNKSPESIATAGNYQNLGSDQYNLEYTVTGNTSGLSSLTYAFDGVDTITINAYATTSTAVSAELTVRDKYSSPVIYKTVKFTISATGSGPATVTVNGTDNGMDNTAPVITLNGANPQTVSLGGQYTELGATVTDNLDTNITMRINSTAVNMAVLGTYSVTYNAMDSNGNEAIQVVRTVIVSDQSAPTVTKLGNGMIDYFIEGYKSAYLVFSERLSTASQADVQAALTAGCDRSLTYSWTDATLTITRSGSSTGKFSNDVRTTITDLAGNSTINALLIDSETKVSSLSTLGNGGTAGKIENGDTITLIFTDEMDTIGMGSGANFNVTVVDSSGWWDGVSIVTIYKGAAVTTTAQKIGTITVSAQYNNSGNTMRFNSSSGVWSNNNKTLTITLSNITGGTARTDRNSSAISIVAGPISKDLAGNAVSTDTVTGVSSRF